MKKRKFAEGGEFELSDEAQASGLRMGRNTNISDADREAAIAEVERAVAGAKNFKALSDQEAANMMGREVITPAQRAAESAARATPRAAPRAAPVSMGSPEQQSAGTRTSRGNENDYSMNAQEGTGGGQAARAPSRGDYSRNGPIGDLIEQAQESRGKVTPRLNMVPAPSFDGLTSRKPKMIPRPKGMSDSPYKKGGSVKSSASRRADGCCVKGKTKGRML